MRVRVRGCVTGAGEERERERVTVRVPPIRRSPRGRKKDITGNISEGHVENMTILHYYLTKLTISE